VPSPASPLRGLESIGDLVGRGPRRSCHPQMEVRLRCLDAIRSEGYAAITIPATSRKNEVIGPRLHDFQREPVVGYRCVAAELPAAQSFPRSLIHGREP
jgi:hypothetical protein